MSFQTSRAIQFRQAYERSAEGRLSKALAEVARTHHMTERLRVQGAGYHLAEQHWQYCQASSCSIAFRAMYEANVPGYREKRITRVKRIEQQKKRIERSTANAKHRHEYDSIA